MCEQLLQQGEVAGIHHSFKMAQRTSGQAVDRRSRLRRAPAFVVSRILKTDGEGVGPSGRGAEFRHDPGDDGGIKSAGEEDSAGNVGHQPLFHRLLDEAPHFVRRVPERELLFQ